MVPYEIIKADNGDAWVKVDDKKLAPPQVSAEVLKKLKKTAEEHLGHEVTEAVITVPCLLYTSDAADEQRGVDLGGRRSIKKKKKKKKTKRKKKKKKQTTEHKMSQRTE